MGWRYYLFKIALSFLLLPGVMVAALLFSALFARRFRRFFLLLALLFYLLSTQFMGNLLLGPLERPWNHTPPDTAADAVVVLGSGHYKGSANLPLSQSGIKRLLYGMEIAKRKNLPLLFSGAGAESIAAEESAKELAQSFDLNLTIMRAPRYLRSFRLYLERRAQNTAQNAAYSTHFFTENGIAHPTIYLVTSASHMFRAKAAFEKAGCSVLPAATDFRITSEFCYCFFFPSLDGLALNAIALYEYLALLKTAL